MNRFKDTSRKNICSRPENSCPKHKGDSRKMYISVICWQNWTCWEEKINRLLQLCRNLLGAILGMCFTDINYTDCFTAKGSSRSERTFERGSFTVATHTWNGRCPDVRKNRFLFLSFSCRRIIVASSTGYGYAFRFREIRFYYLLLGKNG